MQVKEIFKIVCSLLGKEELLDSSYFDPNGNELTDDLSADLNKMLWCLDSVIEEISLSYLPLLKEKEVTFNNGKVTVSDIDQNIFGIIGIKTKTGRNLKYKYINNEIVCLTNSAIVTYKVHPEQTTLNGTAEDFSGRLTARILAYGVASEYCYLDMLYDDATIWENRFKNALFYISEKKGELKLKQRGWY